MAENELTRLHDALKRFAADVAGALGAQTTGDPENQLRGPLQNLWRDIGVAFGRPITTIGETHIRRIGKPDFAVESDGLLIGHIKFQAPRARAVAYRLGCSGEREAAQTTLSHNLAAPPRVQGNPWKKQVTQVADANFYLPRGLTTLDRHHVENLLAAPR